MCTLSLKYKIKPCVCGGRYVLDIKYPVCKQNSKPRASKRD